MVYYTIDYVAAQTEIDSMEWFGQMALSAGDRIPNQVGKESISNMKRVSIADVAKVAGVSVATVSNALNGKGRVGADTAKKIKEIAEELGYTPSLAAQAMSRKRVKIGIFIYQFPMEVMTPIRMGIEKATRYYSQFEMDFQVFHCDHDAMEDIFSANAKNMDGCVVIPGAGSQERPEVFRRYAAKSPLLLLQSGMDPEYRIPSVMIDAEMVGRIGAEYISALHGGKPLNTAIIIGEANAQIHRSNITGYREEAAARQIAITEIAESGDQMDRAYDVMGQILRNTPKLDGVFVTSYVSPAVCQCLRDLGREEISVVGVDLFAESRRCLEEGQLDMVIFQNQQLQGYTAVEMMAEFFHTKSALVDRRIKPEIVLRSNAALY